MGMNALPACPAMLLSSQQTHFLKLAPLTAPCCSSVTLLFPVPQHAACCPLPSSTQPRGTEGTPLLHLPVPRGCGLKAQSSAGLEGPSPQGPFFLDGPGVIVSHHREAGMHRRAARGSQPPQDCISLHSWRENFTEGKKELRALLHAYR